MDSVRGPREESAECAHKELQSANRPMELLAIATPVSSWKRGFHPEPMSASLAADGLPVKGIRWALCALPAGVRHHHHARGCVTRDF